MKNRGKFRFKRGPDPGFSLIELLVVIANSPDDARMVRPRRGVAELTILPSRLTMTAITPPSVGLWLAFAATLAVSFAVAPVAYSADHSTGAGADPPPIFSVRLLDGPVAEAVQPHRICMLAHDPDRFLQAASRFCRQAALDPLHRHEDRLTGLHANTPIG
jgi:hypothetical protein